MALRDYNSLVLNIENYSKRPDTSEAIETFIALAEKKIDQFLKIRNNEKLEYATLNTNDRFIVFPNYYHKMRSLHLIDRDYRYNLVYKTPDVLTVLPYKHQPSFYTLLDRIHLDCVPDKNYQLEMVFQTKLIPLSPTNQTNNIIVEHPNLYLYACLEQLFIWAQDYQSASLYERKFETEVMMVNKTERREKYSSGIYMSIEGSPP